MRNTFYKQNPLTSHKFSCSQNRVMFNNKLWSQKEAVPGPGLINMTLRPQKGTLVHNHIINSAWLHPPQETWQLSRAVLFYKKAHTSDISLLWGWGQLLTRDHLKVLLFSPMLVTKLSEDYCHTLQLRATLTSEEKGMWPWTLRYLYHIQQKPYRRLSPTTY